MYWVCHSSHGPKINIGSPTITNSEVVGDISGGGDHDYVNVDGGDSDIGNGNGGQ